MNYKYFKDGDNEFSLNNILNAINGDINIYSLTVCPCLGTKDNSFKIENLLNGIYCVSLNKS